MLLLYIAQCTLWNTVNNTDSCVEITWVQSNPFSNGSKMNSFFLKQIMPEIEGNIWE